MDDRVFMPGEAEVTDLPLFQRLQADLEGAIGREDPIGVIVIKLLRMHNESGLRFASMFAQILNSKSDGPATIIRNKDCKGSSQ